MNCILTEIWSSFLSKCQNSWGKIGTSRIQCGLWVEYLSTSCDRLWSWCQTYMHTYVHMSFVHTSYKSGLSETTVYEVRVFFSKPSENGQNLNRQPSFVVLKSERRHSGRSGLPDIKQDIMAKWEQQTGEFPLKCVHMKTSWSSAWRMCWNDE